MKRKNRTNTIKLSKGEKIFDIFNNIMMAFVVIIMVYPIWYVVMASFSDGKLLMEHSGVLLKPLGFSREPYKLMAKHPLVLRSYLNTIYLVAAKTVLNIIFTSMGAYFLSRKGVHWQKHIMIMITISMFFSGGMIPTYLINTKVYNLNNSYWALILPGLIHTYNLIIMKTSFAAIPESLIESARIVVKYFFQLLFRLQRQQLP